MFEKIKKNFIKVCLGVIVVELLIVIWYLHRLIDGFKWGFGGI